MSSKSSSLDQFKAILLNYLFESKILHATITSGSDNPKPGMCQLEREHFVLQGAALLFLKINQLYLSHRCSNKAPPFPQPVLHLGDPI